MSPLVGVPHKLTALRMGLGHRRVLRTNRRTPVRRFPAADPRRHRLAGIVYERLRSFAQAHPWRWAAIFGALVAAILLGVGATGGAAIFTGLLMFVGVGSSPVAPDSRRLSALPRRPATPGRLALSPYGGAAQTRAQRTPGSRRQGSARHPHPGRQHGGAATRAPRRWRVRGTPGTTTPPRPEPCDGVAAGSTGRAVCSKLITCRGPRRLPSVLPRASIRR